MVHNGAMSTKPLPPQTIRLTIPVSAEVHATFTRLAKASGKSVGRSMGEWLGDTLEASEFLAVTMERARQSPRLVIRELQAYTLGLNDELMDVMATVRARGVADRARGVADRAADKAAREAVQRGPACGDTASAEGVGVPTSPVSNTGGKVTTGRKPKTPNAAKFPLPPAKVQAYADTNGKPPKGQK